MTLHVLYTGKSPGLKRTVTIQPGAAGKVHSPLAEMALPAVYVSDEAGCLSPMTHGGPKSARRSADMSAQFRTVKSSDLPQFIPPREPGPDRVLDAKIEAKTAGDVVSKEGGEPEQRVSDEGIKTGSRLLTGDSRSEHRHSHACISVQASSTVGLSIYHRCFVSLLKQCTKQ